MIHGPRTRSPTATAAIIALLLLTSTLFLSTAGAQDLPDVQPEPTPTSATYPEEQNCNPPIDGGEWELATPVLEIERQVICVNQTISVHKFIIREGNNVTFYNVDLTIVPHAPRGNGHTDGVFVDGGIQGNAGDAGNPGRLHAYDSTFRTTWRHEAEISVLDNAVLNLVNSTVIGYYAIGYSPGNDMPPQTPGGIGLIEDSRFYDFDDGIVVFDSAVTVRDSFFDGAIVSALYTQGKAVFEGNTITNCNTGIEFQFDAAIPTIRDNTITNCQVGIAQLGSEIPQTINGNDIFWNRRCIGSGFCPTVDAGFEGDASNNWWGSDPPDDSRIFYANYSPWRTSPVHPERLPTPIITGAPASIHVGDTFTLDGSQSLPSAEFGFPITRYLWDFGDGTPAEGATATHAYDAVGSYTVVMRVVDEKNLSHTAQVDIAVTNAAPSLDLAFDPAPPALDQALRVVPAAVDPEGDAVQLSYLWSRNGAVQEDLTTDTVPLERLSGLDTWTATVTATDEYGASTTTEASVQVPNRAPVIDSLQLSPASPDVTTSLTADASASDPDGHPTTITHQWFRDGVEQTDLTGTVVPSHRLSRSETWTVRVTPSDGTTDGAPAEASVVVGNAEPTPTSVTLPPSPTTDTNLQATATGTDPDGDELSWSFAWYRDDQLVPDQTTDSVATSVTQKGETWRVSATPSDGDAVGESVSAQVVIQNTAPRITSLSFQNPAPGTTADLDLGVVALDADGDAFDLDFQWYQDGVLVEDLTGAVVPAARTAKGEIWRAMVTPSDGESAGDSVEANIVIQNTPPTGSVSLPTSAGTEDDLTATVTATDADGDAVTWTHTWLRDDAPTAYTGATLDQAATSRGEEWTVQATPADGEAEGSTVTASTVIQNMPPQIVEVTLSPTDPTIETGLHVTATADDPDGDAVTWTYAWSHNGVQQPDLATDVVPGSRLSKGDSWSVTVTPSDDTDAGTPDTATATIQNAAPRIPRLLFRDEAPGTAADLVLDITATDADGDDVTAAIQWYRDGSLVADLTSSVVPASWTTKGETWRAVVTPSDGESSGSPAEASIVIQNTPPAGSVSLPGDAGTEADLVPVVAATDADGDEVTWSYAWLRNGEPTAYTGATLDHAATSRGEEWTVQATPTDGEDQGVTVSASTVIQNTPPRALDIDLSPGTPTVETGITATPTAEDSDGDSVTWTYEWSRNGVEQADLTGSTVPGSRLAKGDSWSVTVTPSDDELSGEPATRSALVRNAAPRITSLNWAGEAAAGEDLVVGVQATDGDGDPVTYTYAWTEDGEPTSYTSNRVPGSAVDVDDAWSVHVTPSDGQDQGTAEPLEVTIGNRAPILTVTLPQDAQRGADLAAVVEAGDEDGDPVTLTYAWTRNEQPTGHSAASVPGDELWKGDAWRVTVTVSDGRDEVTAWVETVIQNTPPSLTGLLIDPAAGTTSTTFTATAAAEDIDEDDVTVSLAWSREGDDYTVQGAVLPAEETLRDETWIVTATATDPDGATSTASQSIVIGNAAPAVDLHLDPVQPRGTDDLVATVSVVDPDGDAVTACTLHWYVEGRDVGPQPCSEARLDEVEFEKGDAVRAWAYATDEDDAVGTAETTTTIVDSPPTATVTLPSVESGEELVATVEVGDVDGDAVSCTYDWFLNDASHSTGAGCQPSVPATEVSRGDAWRVSLTATADGATTTATSNTVTVQNAAPALTGLAIPTVDSSQELEASYAVLDAEGDALSCTATWSRNGAQHSTDSNDCTAAFSVPASETARGDEWSLILEASDGQETVTAAATATIQNAAPRIQALSLSPGEVRAGDEIQASFLLEDADGAVEACAVAWFLDQGTGPVEVDAASCALGTNTVTYGGPAVASGDEVLVRVSVTDNDQGAAGEVARRVGNTAPVIDAVTAVVGRSNEGIHATAQATDADGDSLECVFTWTMSTTSLDTTSPCAEGFLAGEHLQKGQEWTLSVSAWDGSDASPTVHHSNVLVPGNALPALTGFSFEPSPAYRGQDITVTPTAVDHDGDTVEIAIQWTGPNGATHDGATLPAAMVEAGRWSLQFTLDDWEETATTSGELQVLNRAPTITITLDPASPRTGDAVTATVTATDPDGDDVTLSSAWTGPGGSIIGNILPSSSTARDQAWTLTATATDGDATTTQSRTVVIQNTPPTATGLQFTPAQPRADQDLSASLNGATDADGDSVSATYTWTSSTGHTHTGATVPHSKLTEGAAWNVIATPTDGTTTGTTVSASITILAGDADGDGAADDADNCPTTPNPSQSDLDGDGSGDACDTDADGDGYTTSQETTAGSSDQDAASTPEDLDGDGVPNASDACPGHRDSADMDGDGTPDACDGDVDGDGAANADDAFPRDPAESKDADRDGVGDKGDACPGHDDREDLDGDGVPDGCDDDLDGDGVPNTEDAYPQDPSRSEVVVLHWEGMCPNCDDVEDVLQQAVLPEQVRVIVRDGNASLAIRLPAGTNAQHLLVFRFSTPTLLGRIAVVDGQREYQYEAGPVPEGEHHFGVIGIQDESQEDAVVAAVVDPSRVASSLPVTRAGIVACLGALDSDGDGVCDEVERDWGMDPATPDALPGEPLNEEPTGAAFMWGPVSSVLLLVVVAVMVVMSFRRGLKQSDQPPLLPHQRR